jgi:DNA polymerase-3 subunit epsilon
MVGLAWLARWFSGLHRASLRSLLEEGFVAIDLETTGLDPRRDDIVAFAAIPFAGGEPKPGHVTLVNPRRPIPAAATAIHGITDDMVAGAPPSRRLAADLPGILGNRVLVGHGIGFDLAVLGRELRTNGLPPLRNLALDTRSLAAALHRRWPDFSLESVAERTGVTIVGRHTADGDAVAAGRILLALVPALQTRGFQTVPQLIAFQRRAHLRL